jgi:hypothetical protein
MFWERFFKIRKRTLTAEACGSMKLSIRLIDDFIRLKATCITPVVLTYDSLNLRIFYLKKVSNR